MIFRPARSGKSQHSQSVIGTGAYHREIGREATARTYGVAPQIGAYHREIGREATATYTRINQIYEAYHREIGREATARA